MNAIHQAYAPDAEIVAVMVEQPNTLPANQLYCQAVQDGAGLEFTVLYDADQTIEAYNNGATANGLGFVTDAAGTVVFKKKWPSVAEVEAQLDAALAP